MKIYQQITGYNKAILSADINLSEKDSSFTIAGGFMDAELGVTGMITGFVFSGYSGYIFDSVGDFIYGYRANENISISVHDHGNDRISYFINDTLIKNNTTGISFNSVEVEKHEESTVFLTHIGQENDLLINNILFDNSGNILISSDNILLRIAS